MILKNDLSDISYVSSLILELRRNIAMNHDRYVYLEARIGLVDTSTLGVGMLTVNNVRVFCYNKH